MCSNDCTYLSRDKDLSVVSLEKVVLFEHPLSQPQFSLRLSLPLLEPELICPSASEELKWTGSQMGKRS